MNILHKVTRQILRKNKTRTWVTVIGILLSAAMFTAVTTCVSSLQNFLLRTVTAANGDWHGAQFALNAEDLQTLKERDDVQLYTVLERIGYAQSESTNTYKPYIMVCGFDQNLTELLPIRLTRGRMPKNGRELLLPEHLKNNGQVEFQLGETVVLQMGERRMDDWVMDQHNPYDPKEEFLPTEAHTYTVVGFYERPSFEEYTAPGYTALTRSEGEVTSADVYIRMKSPKAIYNLLDDSARANEVNTDLLRYTGMSNEGSYNRMLYSMAAILMGIISFGSISLIYNAFSISVGERTKQFGILKTIGATKRQLRGSVIYEALALSAIGIPLGVFFGILGIFITLQCTGDLFDALLEGYGVSLRLYVSVPSVLVAAAVCLVTVLISAWIPARRAIRRDAIESVRQNADIAIKAKKVKSPRWIYKLFGFEGMLADKNFKRNRKRYRTTVVSLFVSVVLFISASSFCAYMNDAVETVAVTGDYELSYYLDSGKELPLEREEFRQELMELKSIDGVTYFSTRYIRVHIEESDLTREYLDYRRRYDEERLAAAEESGAIYEADGLVDTRIYFFDDDTFRAWAKEQRLDPEDYFEQPLAIAVDRVTKWDYSGTSREIIDHLKKEQVNYRYTDSSIEGYTQVEQIEEDGEIICIFENEAGDRVEYAHGDPVFEHTGRIGAVVRKNPLGTTRNMLELIYPMSMCDEVMAHFDILSSGEFQIDTDQPKKAEEEVRALLKELDMSTGTLHNRFAGSESDRALVGVINVFSYGFIILISLIALANVFNTISTNIALRRREFAMLRSVGMTEKGLNKMMNFECVLYGVKGLSWGLLAAVGVTWLIYISINSGVETNFYLPWYSVVIAVSSVFAVVFATMLYAMRKIKKEDPIEALKNENL